MKASTSEIELEKLSRIVWLEYWMKILWRHSSILELLKAARLTRRRGGPVPTSYQMLTAAAAGLGPVLLLAAATPAARTEQQALPCPSPSAVPDLGTSVATGQPKEDRK